jgi:hypothetical protein
MAVTPLDDTTVPPRIDGTHIWQWTARQHR